MFAPEADDEAGAAIAARCEYGSLFLRHTYCISYSIDYTYSRIIGMVRMAVFNAPYAAALYLWPALPYRFVNDY